VNRRNIFKGDHPFYSPLHPGEGRWVRQLGIASAATVVSGIPTSLLENARKLRKNQTPAERLLWHALRNRKLHRWKFRRQHPLSGFILDFYCAERRVAVELDGDYHALNEQKLYDKNRTEVLAEFGIRVIRIPNIAVLDNIENVLRQITAFTLLSTQKSDAE
jgi:very-short-patch-repair endonuclease